MRGIIVFLSVLAMGLAAQAKQQPLETDAERLVNDLKAPIYNPFIERYILDDLKQLRTELAAQRAEMIKTVVDRDLLVSDRAINYSANTVTYFFYLIAAVSSVLVIVGWTSIRDIRDKVHSAADKEVQKLVKVYEQRLRAIETQLTQKTMHIDQNRDDIKKTQDIHSLWLRASQEQSAASKILIYDEILAIKPTDCEALTYKADAILEINEPNWARELCLQALAGDPLYAYAHYQMACANAALGSLDEAVVSLNKAISISESFIAEAAKDAALAPLQDLPAFQSLIASELTETNTVQSLS